MKIKLTKLKDFKEPILQAVKKRWLLIAALALGIMLLTLPGKGEKADKTAKTESVPEFSLENEEKKIAAALEKLDGVGKVSVTLTLESSVERKIARDESTQYKTLSEGYELQSESSVVRLQGSSSSQEPVTLKFVYPRYKGALIIAENAGAALKLEIVNAVSSLTGLSSDKITVASGR